MRNKSTVIINPCSSARKNNWRNWPQQNYAKVINYLMQQDVNIILTGVPAAEELKFTQDILQQCQQQPGTFRPILIAFQQTVNSYPVAL
ncbi:MAG: glycosyltransferase family 9 protein [Gammaproteobacteria bacterium]|nr:glycosyltransferase family 9 protein [Gammaproteobacteria bacterium]